MKLDGSQPSPLDDRSERKTVIARRNCGAGRGGRGIGMREIKVGVLGNAAKQHTGLRATQLIPADVRGFDVCWQSPNLIWEKSEAGSTRRLFALCEHSLQSKAEPQDWHARIVCLAQ